MLTRKNYRGKPLRITAILLTSPGVNEYLHEFVINRFSDAIRLPGKLK